ncbi:MAG: hypothetical protein IPJ08_25135 [Burkholderiales bacterium]|nr:hypothetical protein [Burkholderiales bacterium]
MLHETPEAVFTVEIAGVEHPTTWKATEPGPMVLSSVAVLDTRCARAYADQEGELIFSPWGLDVVQNLARVVFPAVEALVKAEQGKLQLSDVAFTD